MNEFSHNAKFALAIAEKPIRGTVQDPDKIWKEFLGNYRSHIRPTEDIQMIHENVWLIPLDTGMPFVGRLLDWTNMAGIPLRILFLDEEPDWIQYPKPVETKPS
jgi:hypothetical protein